jgi:hypothetical protein
MLQDLQVFEHFEVILQVENSTNSNFLWQSLTQNFNE